MKDVNISPRQNPQNGQNKTPITNFLTSINQRRCPICYNAFNTKKRIPMTLCSSQHNICRKCLKGIVKTQVHTVRVCPLCKQKMKNKTVKKNRLLFQLINAIESTQPISPQQKQISDQQDSQINGPLTNHMEDQSEQSQIQLENYMRSGLDLGWMHNFQRNFIPIYENIRMPMIANTDRGLMREYQNPQITPGSFIRRVFFSGNNNGLEPSSIANLTNNRPNPPRILNLTEIAPTAPSIMQTLRRIRFSQSNQRIRQETNLEAQQNRQDVSISQILNQESQFQAYLNNQNQEIQVNRNANQVNQIQQNNQQQGRTLRASTLRTRRPINLEQNIIASEKQKRRQQRRRRRIANQNRIREAVQSRRIEILKQRRQWRQRRRERRRILYLNQLRAIRGQITNQTTNQVNKRQIYQVNQINRYKSGRKIRNTN